MAQRIQLPDGSIAEFPDDFSEDQITEVLRNTDLSSRQAEGGQSSDGAALPLGGNAGAGPTLDPAGNPIDLDRAMVSNADGSISTERTISVSDADGTTFLIPTLIDGRQVSNEEAERMFRSGANPAVGTFDSVDEATAAAEARSRKIGELRNEQQFTRNFTDDPDDPLRTVPTEIGGVTLSQDIREAILQGRSIEDPREKLLLAARVGGRIAAGALDPDAPGTLAGAALGDPEVLATFFRGLGTGVFGLGDIAGAVGVKLSEPNLSFGEALAFQREFRRAKEEAFPLAAVTGEITGAIGSGAAFIKIARQVFAGTRVAPAIEKATVFTKDGGFKGFVKNSGRATLAGGTAGAITEGISEGEPLHGLGVGILAGPLGVGVAKAAQIGLPAARRFLLDPAAKGIRIFAKQMNKSADEMALRFLRFQAVTGRKPTMADIMNDEAAAELNAMIARHTSASTIAREGAEAAAARRAADLAGDIRGPSGRQPLVTTTQRAQTAARGRVGDIQFGAARADDFEFSAQQVQDFLSDPDVRSAMPASLRRRFDEILTKVPQGKGATVPGVDVVDLRQALGDRAKGATGADFVFKELVDELDAIAGPQSENFALALDRFLARSQRIEGVGAGRALVKGKTSEAEALTQAVTSPDLGAGIRVGARSELVDVAREGPEQAARLARTLADDTGLLARLRTVFKPREVERLQELGTIVARSARNTGNLAPAIRAEQKLLDEVVGETVDAVAVGSGAGGAFRANWVTRQLVRLKPGPSKRTMENIARDLFDPEKTEEALAAMRRLGLNEVQLYDLFIGGMAAGTLASNP